MTSQDTTQRPSLRSQRLNQITHEPHSQLDQLVKAHAPFETPANFARFVVAQYLFQSELVALYNAPELIALIPDLPAEALGWIFVSEGSKLGAAFLIKRAVGLGLSETFGARHLGEPAGGRAEGWKSFIKTLDSLEFSAEEEAAVEKGAIDAFVRFTVLLEQAYASAPELA